MKLKKNSRKLILLLLASGASLILGLLSFSGMFALWPILPLAFATFALSVGYEMEIYFQNIKGAWNKLFKHNSLQRQLAKDFLLENFPDTEKANCPQFFKDYDLQLQLLESFGKKHLNKEGRTRKKQIEKTLRDMEKWFALQLFDNADEGRLGYEIQLKTWFKDPEQQAKRKNTQQLHAERQNSFWWAQHFSIFAGIFMGLGTTYLLVEAFSIIPFIAFLPVVVWPVFIVPMAIVAGAAYGLLTYNAVTDMITDETLQEWLKDLGLMERDAHKKHGHVHDHKEQEEHHEHHEHHHGTANYLKPLIGWPLVILALGLTICTAGTWWTIVKETRPLFNWMTKIPSFIMGIVNPVITSFSAIVFNLQNTRESLAMILEMIAEAGHALTDLADSLKNGYGRLRQRENLWQVFNPARIVLVATITPLRILLFLGHLVSIAVSSDRLPGVSQRISAALGFASEFFEDLHYFFGHTHAKPAHRTEKEHLRQQRLGKEHGHNHDLDIPTTVLKWLLTPLYYLAMWWDWGFSQMNSGTPESDTPFVLSYDDAKKKMGFEVEEEAPDLGHLDHPSSEWTLTHTVYRIGRFLEKEEAVDTTEREALTTLQQSLCHNASDTSSIKSAVIEAKTSIGQNSVQFFRTRTDVFLEEELINRVGLGR